MLRAYNWAAGNQNARELVDGVSMKDSMELLSAPFAVVHCSLGADAAITYTWPLPAAMATAAYSPLDSCTSYLQGGTTPRQRAAAPNPLAAAKFEGAAARVQAAGHMDAVEKDEGQMTVEGQG